MKLFKTAKIKLNIPVSEIMPTINAYTKAFNIICQDGYEAKIHNNIKLHHLTYYKIRELIPELPSELVQCARKRASAALATNKNKDRNNAGKRNNDGDLISKSKCPKSKIQSLNFTKKSFTLFLKDKIITFSSISGRKKCTFEINEYNQNYFMNWKYSYAEIILSKNKKKVYLHICFEKDIEDTKQNGNLIGIDRGITNIAVTSNNQFFGGGVVKNQINKIQKIRKKLQSKGTKSAKRHLRKLSGKEKRFRADINHQISKQIIDSLNPGDTIVLEDLTGIRNKRIKGKKLRSLINDWSFFQLERFIKYKADAKGIKVVYIDPRFTSQRCDKCGFTSRDNRKTPSGFCCKKCKFTLNADLNASRNICTKALESYMFSNGAFINKPIVSDEDIIFIEVQASSIMKK